ncbi:MAG: hypothetical protein ACI83I_002726 [Bacteroidia bacterium]|jgi:hypothetical protein
MDEHFVILIGVLVDHTIIQLQLGESFGCGQAIICIQPNLLKWLKKRM